MVIIFDKFNIFSKIFHLKHKSLDTKRDQQKKGWSKPTFQCPGQDSNLHELMLTTPSK